MRPKPNAPASGLTKPRPLADETKTLTVLTPAQCADADPRGYVIKGLVAPADHAQVLGLPSAGKSLLAPFAAYCIAQGVPFFGRRVRQGPVLYFAAEDGHGMKRRVRALMTRYGDAPLFRLIPDSINLRNEDSSDPSRIRSLIWEYQPVAVFVDTVASAFPGLRENDPDAMSHATYTLRELTRTPCGPAVISVHHVAKDGGGGTPRGHGVLFGDLDVTIIIEGEKAQPRSVTLGKNRNGPSDAAFSFGIEVEDFGLDEDGDPILAPIAVPAEGNAPVRRTEKEAKLHDKPKLMLRELRDLVDRDGEMLCPAPTYPMVRAVTRNAFRNRLIERAWFAENLLLKTDDGSMKLDRKAYTPENNALSTLKAKGFASFNPTYVWLL